MPTGGDLLTTSDELHGLDPTVDFLRSAGADAFPHARGRTLLDHLLQTRAITRRWGQPWWVAEAAALHSVYSTDVYRLQLLEHSRREEVRRIVGIRAERMAYLFCTVPRRALFSLAEGDRARPRDGDAGSAEGQALLGDLTGSDVQHLLLLHAANEAEQVCDEHGGPGAWLATVSRRMIGLSGGEVVVPPSFAGCTRLVDGDAERRARDAYAAGTSGLQDADAAWIHFRHALDACPWVGEPCIWRAYLALHWRRPADTMMWSSEGIRRLRELGVTWDKRLEFGGWLTFAATLRRAASEAIALPAFDPGAPSESVAAMTEALTAARSPRACRRPAGDPPTSIMPDRLAAYLASLAHNEQRSLMGYYPGLPARPWHDPSQIPIVADLEAAYAEIAAEIRALPTDAFHRESERISRTGDWDVLIFHERGQRNVANCDRCPVTTEIIAAHDTVRSLSGLIYVSRMKPGTHIAAHRGPTNMRLRCHLALTVPDGDCAIRVGTETRGWEEGRCIVFDDYFDHEAWNHTSQERIVMVVDIWHPDLSAQEIAVIEGLQRYASAQADSLRRYWSANEQARAGAYH
ncbi:MAG: aspartyl/asparaginyl beta-hydroxylase domain-containing protein [Solirubrobacteraceae bacterium]